MTNQSSQIGNIWFGRMANTRTTPMCATASILAKTLTVIAATIFTSLGMLLNAQVALQQNQHVHQNKAQIDPRSVTPIVLAAKDSSGHCIFHEDERFEGGGYWQYPGSRGQEAKPYRDQCEREYRDSLVGDGSGVCSGPSHYHSLSGVLPPWSPHDYGRPGIDLDGLCHRNDNDRPVRQQPVIPKVRFQPDPKSDWA